jgi:uncharacterized membrane protein YfbV (UPF0208 family)
MQTIFAWLAILGFLPLILRAAMNGALSPEWAAVLMLLMVVAVCIGVKKFVFKVVVPIAAVVLLAAQYSNGDTKTFGAILSALFTLSLMLLGFYIMLRGVFVAHRSKRKD